MVAVGAASSIGSLKDLVVVVVVVVSDVYTLHSHLDLLCRRRRRRCRRRRQQFYSSSQSSFSSFCQEAYFLF